MRSTLLTTVLLAAVAFVAGGCDSAATLKDQNAMLSEENQTLRAQLDDRNEALDSTTQQLRDREIEIADLRREANARPAAAAPTQTGFEGISGVRGEMGAGEVTAVVEGDILFDAGKTSLKSAAKRTLDQIASVLKTNYAGRAVRVEGHTDSDPIRKSGFTSNYHLGFERGYAVRDYLASRGIDENEIHVASFGPNESMSSKAASRRVEIVVVLN
ncbi:MAG: OmpA/MotB family protein [Planctomycetota bacterium]|jgi:chemotaxis protein MotB